VTPVRIQLRRTKGWRMPPNTVSVARPSRWGNPFTVSRAMALGLATSPAQAVRVCVDAHRCWLDTGFHRGWVPPEEWGWVPTDFDGLRARVFDSLDLLVGRNLACFCAPDAPCHGDTLLEFVATVRAP
jgi:hypothetical protein